MPQSTEFRDKVNASADAVMEKVLDMDFIREWSVVQEAIDPNPQLLERTDTGAKIRIDLFEPIPTLGKIKAQLNFEWDITKKLCKWVRTAEGVGAKSFVNGTTEIVPIDDNSCEFVDIIHFDIKIPLMGKKMEKMAIEHMRKGRAEKMAFLNKNV